MEKGVFMFCKFQEILHALETENQLQNSVRRETIEQWVRRDPPDGGWRVLNTDGDVKGNPGPVGASGVITGDKGEWIIGFSENLGYCSSIKAEIRAVLHGLKIAKEGCSHKLWIQIDSKAVVTMLTSHKLGHPEYSLLIQQYKHLLDWGG